MAKDVFISFRYNDQVWESNIEGLFQARGGRIAATPKKVPPASGPVPEVEIAQVIRELMNKCCGVIVLVGNDSHNSPWIEDELDLAKKLGKPSIAVHHPQAMGGLPNSYRGMCVLGWNSDELVKAVDGW